MTELLTNYDLRGLVLLPFFIEYISRCETIIRCPVVSANIMVALQLIKSKSLQLKLPSAFYDSSFFLSFFPSSSFHPFLSLPFSVICHLTFLFPVMFTSSCHVYILPVMFSRIYPHVLSSWLFVVTSLISASWHSGISD